MVGLVMVGFGATVLWEGLVLVGRVRLSTLAWRRSTKHIIVKSVPEKDLAVASGNLRHRVETRGLRGGRESRKRKQGRDLGDHGI